ncbi:MAG: hypothetical protein ACR2NX_11450 [Chthoniobacterales bacterium]
MKRFILAACTVGDKERTQRMALETVLEGFGESDGGDGTANESDADRLELLRWQRLGRIAGPEAVTVA